MDILAIRAELTEHQIMDDCSRPDSVSLSYNVTYIDIRQVFLDADRWKGWDQSSGYLTTDGEHPSEAGSKIEEDLFYNQLEQ